MKTLTDQALFTWAHLQDLLSAKRPKQWNPNDNLTWLTLEERQARILVRINSFIKSLKKDR